MACSISEKGVNIVIRIIVLPTQCSLHNSAMQLRHADIVAVGAISGPFLRQVPQKFYFPLDVVLINGFAHVSCVD